jgi:predicted glycoside hydrolase/deacetylase ChbG (UPF0249 family)
MSASPPLRRIWLCADDYGIAPGVNTAIRDLIVRGRLNATSVMVVAPSFNRFEAAALTALNANERRVAIGLHLTLTAPFQPQRRNVAPSQNGSFPTLTRLLAQASLHQLNRDALRSEVESQVAAFEQAFGRKPDFIDGHQHVQLFPQVSDAVLEVVKAKTPGAWLRQCGRALPMLARLRNSKALFLDGLSYRFRRLAAAHGLRTNPAFAGAYVFDERADFAALFPRFLDGLPDGGVAMCHPGFVDDELCRLDPLTALREREYAFFVDDGFPALLARHGVALSHAP